MKILFNLFLLFALFSPPATNLATVGEPGAGNLTVTIEGLKNNRGQIGILVFNKEDGFPSERAKAVKEILLPIEKEDMQYTFANLPFGQYAVSVMHDENANKVLDVNLFGIPKEGNGVSNNVTGRFGPPPFGKAIFSLNQDRQQIAIKLRY